MSALVATQFWEAQLHAALRDWSDIQTKPTRRPYTLAVCHVDRVTRSTRNIEYAFGGFNIALPPMLVGNILCKLPINDRERRLFFWDPRIDEGAPAIKAYLEDAGHLLADDQWQVGRSALHAEFSQYIGAVRIHLMAPSTPWQAGSVSPVQELITQPPANLGYQSFVDNDRRLAQWDPEKQGRRGPQEKEGFHQIPLDSSQGEACTAGLLLWPGQAVSATDEADSQDDAGAA